MNRRQFLTLGAVGGTTFALGGVVRFGWSTARAQGLSVPSVDRLVLTTAVDNIYDHGPVLARARVPVRKGDSVHTLAARVFKAECRVYPAILEKISRGRLRLPIR